MGIKVKGGSFFFGFWACVGAFLIAFGISLISFNSSISERFQGAVDALDEERNFQGLVLDVSGSASFLIRILEKNGSVFVRKVDVTQKAGQHLSQEFFPDKGSGYIDSRLFSRKVLGEGGGRAYRLEVLISPFVYLRAVLYSFFLSLAVGFLVSLALERNERGIQHEFALRYQDLSEQVSHDIRSPLAAFDHLLVDMEALPEETKIIIRRAVGRIRDIANTLLPPKSELIGATDDIGFQTNQSVYSIAQAIVSEKNVQYRSRVDVSIDLIPDQSSYSAFSKVNAGHLKRVFSNLIDNSIESLSGGGSVAVRMEASSAKISLLVKDTGSGIPVEVLQRLGSRKESYGKASGSGLGLYHAKAAIGAFGGTLEISSEVGTGTEVRFSLPRAMPPNWFPEEVRLKSNCILIIVDDDPSIHQTWKVRIADVQTKQAGIQALHFLCPREFFIWSARATEAQKKIIHYFFCDFEFRQDSMSGLDLIEKLGVHQASVLVTDRFEDQSIVDRCMNVGVQVMPKVLASSIPLIIEPDHVPLDCILIDDDENVIRLWSEVARRRKKNIRAFTTFSAFLKAVESMERNTPIYLDSNLGNDLRGEGFVGSVLGLGFHIIYISTGYPVERFAGIKGISGVVGKSPPWV